MVKTDSSEYFSFAREKICPTDFEILFECGLSLYGMLSKFEMRLQYHFSFVYPKLNKINQLIKQYFSFTFVSSSCC